MTSFELDIGEQSRVGSRFIAHISNELKRALAAEKASRKITQQAIAEKIGTSRAVINREIQGLENLSARRIAELFWAIGWEPYFEARQIPVGENQYPTIRLIPIGSSAPAKAQTTQGTVSIQTISAS